MTWILDFWRSTIGKKVVMGVTGLIGVGFVIGHLLANLLIFQGPAAINAYAATLKGLGPALWVARAGLIAAVVLHVVAAVQLTRRQQLARPVGYEKRAPQVSTFASRTIRWGGALLFVFIVFHLLHFTIGTVHPEFSETDVYRNMVIGFSHPVVVLFYVAAMLALGLHLYHGTWSALRTLGASRPTTHPLRRIVPAILAAGVAIGFVLIPLAVIFGMVR